MTHEVKPGRAMVAPVKVCELLILTGKSVS